MNLVDETPYAYKVCKVRYETVKQDSQFLYQNYTNKDTISEIHKQLVILKLITNGKTIPEFAQQIENSIIESRQMFRHEPNCKKLEDEIDMIAKKRDAISTIDIWILMKLVTLIILSIVYIIRPIIIILLWSIKTIKE